MAPGLYQIALPGSRRLRQQVISVPSMSSQQLTAETLPKSWSQAGNGIEHRLRHLPQQARRAAPALAHNAALTCRSSFDRGRN